MLLTVGRIIVDHMPERLFDRVVNRSDLVQVLSFDKWLGNCDSRQVVFTKPKSGRLYRLTCIDQGFCFNAEGWTFLDRPLFGTYRHRSAYGSVSCWDSFEPTISKIEKFDPAQLWKFATDVPEEWYQCQSEKLTTMVEELLNRHSAVRNLICSVRDCLEHPFPHWKD